MKQTEIQEAFREPGWAWLQLIVSVASVALWIWLTLERLLHTDRWHPILLLHGVFIFVPALGAFKAIRRLRRLAALKQLHRAG